MDEQYIIDLKYGNKGLPYIEPIPGAKICAEKHGNTYTIKGNAEGLIFLANTLVALAKMNNQPETEGYHIHIDDLYEINDENIDFILTKEVLWSV